MGKLYLVPTPIGNMEDITLRALRILKEVDIVLAEDTRKTQILLLKHGIEKKIKSYHKDNEHKMLNHITSLLERETSIALVTDAGTPGISDPGFLIVRECISKGIDVECLPGAVAFIPALINSGIPCDRFRFEGFIPQKKGRQKRLEELANEDITLIFYESPHRLLKTLIQFMDFFGENRQASVSRELTKIHEETVRGTLKEVYEYYQNYTLKGEFVIIIGKK